MLKVYLEPTNGDLKLKIIIAHTATKQTLNMTDRSEQPRINRFAIYLVLSLLGFNVRRVYSRLLESSLKALSAPGLGA